MKTKLYLTLAVACTIVASPAVAVQKCVALSSSSSCTYINAGYNTVDWNSNCSLNGKSVPIAGISQCSISEAGTMGSKLDALELSSINPDENFSCWCKMTSPAVSKWVFVGNMAAHEDCLGLCANECAFGVENSATLRAALFSNLSD